MTARLRVARIAVPDWVGSEQIELVDQGSDVVVYRTMLGTKFGQTYKFIDKNTVVLDEPFDKQTFHKVN